MIRFNEPLNLVTYSPIVDSVSAESPRIKNSQKLIKLQLLQQLYTN